MADSTELQGQRLVIVLRRFNAQTPRERIRGIITAIDQAGFRLSGRRFREVADAESPLPVERPVEADTRVYWVPFNSIRYSEIVLPGSSSEKEDNEVQRRKPLTPHELQSQTAP